MLKWIFIGILAFIALALGTCWVGYKRLTAGGNIAAVTVAASQERAWLYFTDTDSMNAWQDNSVTTWHANDSAGFAVGDTMWLHKVSEDTDRSSLGMSFALTRLVPLSVLEWVSVDDSTGFEILRRTDSLISIGDSLRISVSFGTPVFDSLRSSDSIGGFAERLLGGTSNLMSSAMRAGTQVQLDSLRAMLARP